jgi:protein subunit release factor B
MFPVSPKKEDALREHMEALGVREEDLEERFVRSGGRGGQHVNKVSTCVQLRHVPTGLEVRCQSERSQGLNRYRARVLLLRARRAKSGSASRKSADRNEGVPGGRRKKSSGRRRWSQRRNASAP